MAIFPFVLIQQKHLKHDVVLVNHESIHLRQQLELLILPFYLWYSGHYLVNLWRFKNAHRAYREIIFEREAFACENDLEYLQKRRRWAFLKY